MPVIYLWRYVAVADGGVIGPIPSHYIIIYLDKNFEAK